MDDILEYIRDIIEVYVYTCIEGVGQESLNSIKDIISMLEKENVEIPDPKIFAFSKFSEKDGWGNPFDGRYLSITLNRKQNLEK